MRTTMRRIAAWTAGGVLLAGVGSGIGVVAANATGGAGGGTRDSAAVTSTAASAPVQPTNPGQSRHAPRHHPHGSLLARTQHGQFVVRTANGYRTVLVQRGVVTAASPTSVTVRSLDGYAATYVMDSTTRIRQGRTAVPASALHSGEHVMVAAIQTGSTNTARAIQVRTPTAARHGRTAPAPGTSAASAPTVNTA